MEQVTVFLSTPRCGTQWLAKNLGENYPDMATVLHEPIKFDYYPRLNLGKYDSSMLPENNPKLDEHLAFIERETRNKKYIEVGWQSIAGVSEFYRKFGDRLKFIHLYRNPIYVATSLTTLQFYTGEIKDRFEKAELHPFDDISLLAEYRDKWDNLTLYEKSLYYWTEVNLRALEIRQRYPDVPFHSVKFENLFKKNETFSRLTLIEMLSFIGLEYKKDMLDSIIIPYDEYRSTTNLSIDWKKIEDHPQTLTLAKKLGYSLDKEIDLQRYRKPLKKRIAVKIPVKLKHAYKTMIPSKFQVFIESLLFR